MVCNQTSLSQIKSIMERYQEVVVVSLESVVNKCVQRTLADDWRWRRIRLAIKPSRKPLNADKTLLWITIRKSWSLFLNLPWKIAWSALGGEITMMIYPACNNTSLSGKPYIPNKVTMGHYQEVMVALSESVVKNRGDITMTSYQIGNRISWSGKFWSHTNLLWNAIMKSWSQFQNSSWKTAWSAPWWRTDDDFISGL